MESKKNKKKKGRLEVISGCMFSGKTEELIRRLRRAKIAHQEVIVFKPKIDTRSGENKIKSKVGYTFEAEEAASPKEIPKIIASLERLCGIKFDVVGIDEAQFFDESLVKVVNKLIDEGRRVIVSGLDTDFRGEPFGVMPHLIAIADSHLLLTAICMVCREPTAIRTQRLINGKPAHYDSPLIMVGGEELYEARCRNCHEVPKN
jgi:thymidine kinase